MGGIPDGQAQDGARKKSREADAEWWTPMFATQTYSTCGNPNHGCVIHGVLLHVYMFIYVIIRVYSEYQWIYVRNYRMNRQFFITMQVRLPRGLNTFEDLLGIVGCIPVSMEVLMGTTSGRWIFLSCWMTYGWCPGPCADDSEDDLSGWDRWELSIRSDPVARHHPYRSKQLLRLYLEMIFGVCKPPSQGAFGALGHGNWCFTFFIKMQAVRQVYGAKDEPQRETWQFPNAGSWHWHMI